MTASIVRIDARVEHPNADTLTIYKVSNDLDIEIVQVIANQENVYKQGDHAVYIHHGSVLNDGTKITKRKLRDVMSYGMLAGHSDLPVGTDVTGHWCQEEPEPIEVQRTKLKHQAWPSIESFAHVRRHAKSELKLGKVGPFFHMEYAAKVKLHGTNAAVQISPDGEVVAQKRSSVIYPDQDNVGFASWVHQHQEAFRNCGNTFETITIHGEWFGPKIQKGVACSAVAEKQFAVFAIQGGLTQDGSAKYYVEPDCIFTIMGEGPWHILPWHHKIYINFKDDIDLQMVAAKITNEVIAVEECDPFIKETFGIEGIGEGLVYYPHFKDPGGVNAYVMSQYMFKAKGKKHQANAHKDRVVVPVDIEKLNTINEFIDKFITPARLEQAVIEGCNRQYETKLIGNFLKWIGGDVKKESVAELEESNLEWKDIVKPLSTRARGWYQEQIAKQ